MTHDAEAMTDGPRKRGRPRKHDPSRVTTAIRLDRTLQKRLKIEALYRDTSFNDLLVIAAEDWLKKNEGKVR